MILEATEGRTTMSDIHAAMTEFVSTALSRADTGSKAWSAAYHLALGAAGILGIIVGVISQAQFSGTFLSMNKDTTITVLSLIAAVLTFLGAFGGFERKWRANRTYRFKLQQIELDLKNPGIDLAKVREDIRAAAAEHNGGIAPPTP